MQKIEVNTRVKWTSQAGGFHVEKRGVVVYVLPADVPPILNSAYRDEGPIYDVAAKHRAKMQGGSIAARKHESYFVLVSSPMGSKAAPKLYWPVVSLLKVVK
jgi:hypothetical protein